MKTRSNMPLFVLECTDITKLTDGQIDLLRCGDYLVKKTGKQEHAYKVTYKEDKQGICLTYHDASTVETVSYDYTGGHWVYNSTDKGVLPLKDGDAFVFDGDLDVDGKITGNEIIENMSGYSFDKSTETSGVTREYVYVGVVKNGNKLTCVCALNLTFDNAPLGEYGVYMGYLTIPNEIASKLYPTQIGAYGFLDVSQVMALESNLKGIPIMVYSEKAGNGISMTAVANENLEANKKYYVRLEMTFLLSDNLAD